MPRVVLYAEDFEPITIIELGYWAMDYIIEQGYVRLQVMPSVATRPVGDGFYKNDVRIIEIRGDLLIKGNQRHYMLFTSDEVSALLLKAAFLPGQRATLNRIQREAFAEGFLEALQRLGR